MGQAGKPEIGVILPQKYPVLRPGSEHPVRLVHTLRNQVIYKDPYIRFVPAEHERILFHTFQMSINAGDNPLCGSLFIACRTVDLAGQEKVFHHL